MSKPAAEQLQNSVACAATQSSQYIFAVLRDREAGFAEAVDHRFSFGRPDSYFKNTDCCEKDTSATSGLAACCMKSKKVDGHQEPAFETDRSERKL